MMNILAAQCGFSEAKLRAERSGVLSAIMSDDLGGFRSAWRRYQEAAEVQIDALSDEGGLHARAQIGLILAKAGIWFEAGDRVRYMEELYSAQEYAGGMGYADIAGPVNYALRQAVDSSLRPEAYQALGWYEEAIDGYIGLEQNPSLSARERGLVNFRLTECYRALLQDDPDDPEIAGLLDGSLQSALLYLDGEPEQSWALRFLSEIILDGGE